MKSKTLIVIVGPTAVGKTALAIDIAQHFNTEILSADSRQFYKELQIGVASPSAKELLSARHHFIGNLSIIDAYNVSKYEYDALHCLGEVFKYHNSAVLVGGSGLYIDAVCKGIDNLPDPDEEIRNEVKDLFLTEGIEALRSKLRILDPDYYNQVDLANPKRLMRAIEVCLTIGKPYSSLRVNLQKERDFNIIKIGINRPREQLYEIINSRVDLMVDNGLIEEAKGLFVNKHLNALNTVGYKEVFEYLEGNYTIETAIEKIKVNSRRYAKRQLTWFKRDEEIQWFNADDKISIVENLESIISKNKNG